jgi:hypothetical protein
VVRCYSVVALRHCDVAPLQWFRVVIGHSRLHSEEGRGRHSTFTHLRGGLDLEFGKLLISVHLDEPP